MKEHNDKLTLQETEQLCHLYMDCRLSLFEETELQYVLGKLPYSSSCIDEVRRVMGLPVPIGNKISVKEKYGWFSRKNWIGIAASIVILFVVGITVFNNRTIYDYNSSEVYIAYANGKQVSHERSVRQVKSDMEQADEFLNYIADLESQEQELVNNFIKQIEQ